MEKKLNGKKVREIRIKDEFYEQKKDLIEVWKKQGINNKILQAFLDVPRQNFVLKKFYDKSYDDTPLDIGYGQTISQPTTAIMMLNWLDADEKDNVLEIGAGSGYNAALLSKLCKEVISTERIKELVDFAKENIKRLEIKNVQIKYAPKDLGYKEKAPYDKIIVTCGADEVPKELFDQLKEEGILLIPIGEYGNQMMLKLRKVKDTIEQENLGWFSFVPLVR